MDKGGLCQDWGNGWWDTGGWEGQSRTSERRGQSWKGSIGGKHEDKGSLLTWRREESTVDIRKKKRQQGLIKRRVLQGSSKPAEELPVSFDFQGGAAMTSSGREYTARDIAPLCQSLQSLDPSTQLSGLKGLRRVLEATDESDPDPPIQRVLSYGALENFVSLLAQGQSLQEHAWRVRSRR